MTRPRPVTPEELQEIKESVKRARLLADQYSWNSQNKQRGRRNARSTDPPEIRQADLVIARMKFGLDRSLKSKSVREAIKRAIKREDHGFFIRLGTVLRAKPIMTGKMRAANPRALELFLINHWAERRDGFPELFYLTPSDLTLACIQHLGDPTLNQEMVVKVRQRLKMKAFKRMKLHPKYRGNKMVFPQKDS